MVSRRDTLKFGATLVGLGALPGATRAASSGKCVFVYDDGHGKDLTKTLPAHQKVDAPGCIACPSGYIDTEGDDYLDPDDVQTFVDAGWEVLSHMDYHRPVGQARLTQDVEEGDTEIHATNDLHGRFDGDPIQVVDDDGNALELTVGTESTSGFSIASTNESSEEHPRDELSPADKAAELEMSRDSVGIMATTQSSATIPLAEPAPGPVSADANGRVRFPPAFLQEKLERSKSELQALGATAENFVAPFGQYDEFAAQQVGQFYKACANAEVGGGINVDFDPYLLSRQQFAEYSEAELDDLMQRAAEQNALLVLGSHSWDADLTQSDIYAAVERARANDLEITTLHDALVSFGAIDPEGTAPTRRTIEIRGSGPVTKFEFEVSGSVLPVTDPESTDSRRHNTVTGQVSTLEDVYEFTGSLERFTVVEGNESDLTVLVDGEEYIGSRDERKLRIEGTGPVTKFEFSATKGVEPISEPESTDTIYEKRVVGQVSTLDDTYRLLGDLESFVVTEGNKEDINVFLDGKQIAVSEKETDDHEILIEGTGPVVKYDFSVTGTVENAGKLEDTDTLYESRVQGQVSTQDDRFSFTGKLNEFVVTEGNKEDITVSVDGREITVTEETGTESKEILIEGTGPVVQYDFSVSGSVENAGKLEDTDTLYESRVEGQVSTQDDRFNFTGDLEQFVVTDGSKADIVVSVDGEQIPVSEEETDDHEIRIEGTGPVVKYDFSVTGTVENAGKLEDTDTLYESRVKGQVSTQDDRFTFTGDLNEFIVTEGSKADIDVYVDGEEISVTEETGTETKEILIEGTGPVVKYDFSVTGTVENAGKLESTDTLYESRVQGQVSTQDDRFTFTGDLEQFVVTDGSKADIVVSVDGEEISVTEEAGTESKEILIEGTGPVVKYDFSVSGSVENAGKLESTDTLYESRVEGQVSTQDDRFTFTGDLEQFVVTDGSKADIVVSVDGSEIAVSEA